MFREQGVGSCTYICAGCMQLELIRKQFACLQMLLEQFALEFRGFHTEWKWVWIGIGVEFGISFLLIALQVKPACTMNKAPMEYIHLWILALSAAWPT